MVAFNCSRRPLERDALDYVRVKRALGEIPHVAEASRLFFEDPDKLPPDDLPLSLRVLHALQRGKEALGAVNISQVQVEPVLEQVEHFFPFILPEHAVVHKDARELVAYRPVNEGRHHRRIDAAAEGADDLSIARLFADFLRRHLDERSGRKKAFCFADLVKEVFQDDFALGGVVHLWVELDAVDSAALVFYGRIWRILRMGQRRESGRHSHDAVAVAHPDGVLVRHALQKAVRAVQINMGAAVLPLLRPLDLPPIQLRYELYAVADTQDRRARDGIWPGRTPAHRLRSRCADLPRG